MKSASLRGPEQKRGQGTVYRFESTLLRYRILNKQRLQEMVPHNMEKVKIRLVLRKAERLWQMAGRDMKRLSE